MKWDWVVPVAGYTEFWRQTRKLLDRGLRPATASVYRPLQQTKARALLVHLLAKPDEWEAQLEEYVIFPSATLSFFNSFPNCPA